MRQFSAQPSTPAWPTPSSRSLPSWTFSTRSSPDTKPLAVRPSRLESTTPSIVTWLSSRRSWQRRTTSLSRPTCGPRRAEDTSSVSLLTHSIESLNLSPSSSPFKSSPKVQLQESYSLTTTSILTAFYFNTKSNHLICGHLRQHRRVSQARAGRKISNQAPRWDNDRQWSECQVVLSKWSLRSLELLCRTHAKSRRSARTVLVGNAECEKVS